MNDTNTKVDAGLSAEEIAIINAAFKLHEIIITHRSYRRGRRGKLPFTRGAFEQAKKTLAVLRPPSPGADPVRVVAHFAKQPDVAKAAISAAIEKLTKSKQEEWDKILEIEMSDDDLKALSDDSPIFKHYRSVTMLDRAIAELSHPSLPTRAADLAWLLANRIGTPSGNAAAKVAA